MTDQPASSDALSVDHVVIGASDLGASVDFFLGLGFAVLDRRVIGADAARALHGLEAATEEVVLGVDGAASGGVRVVATPLAQVDRGDFFRGGHAVDLYTTDMPASVEAARALGAEVGPVADYEFGPVHLTQAQAVGPDGVDVVFVGIDHRLPSVLDSEPTRLHSEVHSVVASIDDLDAETAFWTKIAGLDLRSQFPIDVPAVSEFMMLPRHAPVRMSVMTGPAAAPPRFELLAFDDAEGRLTPSNPLTAGAIVPVFTVGGLDSYLSQLTAAGATAGPIVVATGADGVEERAAAFRSPAGVDAEVRERRA